MNVRFAGRVIEGRLELGDRESFTNYYKQFEGKNVVISIEKATRKRSSPQNSYLWGIVYKVISEYTGYEIEEVHEICKARFNPQLKELLNKETGELEMMGYSGSTTKLDTVQFMEYVEKIQRFFAPFGVNISDPNQTEFIEDLE